MKEGIFNGNTSGITAANCFVYNNNMKESTSSIKGEICFGDEQHKREPQSDSPSAVLKHTPLSIIIIYNIS